MKEEKAQISNLHRAKDEVKHLGDGDKRRLGKDESLMWWNNPNSNPGKTTLGEDERLMWFLEPPIELTKEERIRLMMDAY